MRISALPALLTLAPTLGPLAAQSTEPGLDRQGSLSFYLDNDLFGNSDRDYTNGSRFAWSSPDFRFEDLSPLAQTLTRLSGDSHSFAPLQAITGFQDPRNVRYNFGVSLTQLIYTPDDNLLTTQPPDQRRYAGWTGLGFSLHAKDQSILNSLEFIIGTTGPDSLAEDTQDLIHDVRHIPEFNGWDNQIPNEITADLSFTQKRLAEIDHDSLSSLEMQRLTTWGARLGTFRTSAHVGAAFRVGFNLPNEFADHRAFDDNAYPIRVVDADSTSDHWSLFTIFGTNLHVVGYDATLDGPVFNNFRTGNERELLVAEVYAGLGVRYRSVELSYVHTWRTKDYEEQENRINDLGSVAIRLRF